jgi:hypothetical protein
MSLRLQLTLQSVFIALQHLYKPSAYLVTPENARAVLATALLFDGMPELVARAYEVCRDSINAANVADYVAWLNRPASATNGHHSTQPMFGSIVAESGSPADAWNDAQINSPFGQWSERLRQDV